VNKEATVKTKGRLMLITAMILFAALAMPVQLAAQDKRDHNNHKHHHYQLIDLGTFGGPTSVNFGIYPALNNESTVIGVADTATANPYYPNCSSDPFVSHAFLTRGGTLTDLGALPGEANSSGPANITSNGLVSGTSLNGAVDLITGCPEENALLWKDGKIINLGTFGGYESGSSSVNSRGQVTGFATNTIPDPFSLFYLTFYGLSNGTQTRAFLWDERNGMQDIGTLGGPDAVSVFINDRGQIAGASYTNDIPNPTTGIPTDDPFLWENGTMTDLGSLGGTFGYEGDGVGLNNRGQVVGYSNLAGDVYTHPFLSTKPGPMLGTLGGNFGNANAINEAGEVVGWATNTGDQAILAFFWKNGTMRNLGVLPGKLCSYAHQINAEGQVTGSSDDDCNDGNSRAFLWENDGPMVDLNDLVSGADMTLGGATGINDRGEITGIGVLANGDAHVFLLIPCDEHHLGLEGCDYNLVNASAAAASGLTAKRQTSLNVNVRKALQQQLGHRYHLPILQGPRD
jgi:probable HAF family extracellular repeat protein